MNWFELLLLFFFVVLPLLQQLLQGRGGRDEGDPPLGGEAPETADQSLPEDWSAGWGAWPGDEDDREQDLPPRPAEPPVPAEPAGPTVVSMEDLHVDRKAEQERLRGRPKTLPPPPAAPPPRLTRLLSGRADLRRAVLLSEILGPPRSLDPSATSAPDSPLLRG